MHRASFFAHPDLVAVLLKRGAPVGVKNGKSETPIELVSGDWNPELEKAYTSIVNMISLPLDRRQAGAFDPTASSIDNAGFANLVVRSRQAHLRDSVLLPGNVFRVRSETRVGFIDRGDFSAIVWRRPS